MEQIGLRGILCGKHLEIVMQRDGIEHRFYVVIAIAAALYDIESQIDFATRKYYHKSAIFR